MDNIMFFRGIPLTTKMLFDRLMSETWDNDMLKMKSNYPMNIVEICDDEEVSSYRIEYAFAGFKKDEINVEIVGDILNVKAEKTEPQNEKEKYLRKGLSFRDFEMSFKLMEEVDIAKITVKYEDGVLKINLPMRKEEAKSHKINID